MKTDSSNPADQTPNQSAIPAAGAPGAEPGKSTPIANEPGTPAAGTPPADAGTTPDAKGAPPAAAVDPATGKPAAAASPTPADGTGPATGVDGKPAAAAPDAALQPPALPEKYELPKIEGIEYNEAVLGVMSPAFKDAKLSQGQVDTVVKTFMEYQKGLPALILARDLEVTLKDPQIGGMNWGRTQGYVNDALGAFTTPEFRQQLDAMGIANNVEFVRCFERIGRAMRGDDIPGGQPTSAGEVSRADKIYGKAKKA